MSNRPTTPSPTQLRRLGPRILLGGVALGFTYAFYATRGQTPNPLRTPGVSNIEKAYSNAGATATHTPAYGGTTMGQKDQHGLKESSATGMPAGLSEDGVGDEQRPAQATKVGKMWNDMKYGSETGK